MGLVYASNTQQTYTNTYNGRFDAKTYKRVCILPVGDDANETEQVWIFMALSPRPILLFLGPPPLLVERPEQQMVSMWLVWRSRLATMPVSDFYIHFVSMF